jgi:aurora kinase
MTSVGSVTRQIAALEISSKKGNSSSSSSLKPTHSKQPSQTNVSKLLTKFAAPNPLQTSHASSKPTYPSSLRNPNPNLSSIKTTSTTNLSSHKQQPSIDIGQYDGGLELENEKRGERVFGQAAEELALDSSTSRYHPDHYRMRTILLTISQKITNPRMEPP